MAAVMIQAGASAMDPSPFRMPPAWQGASQVAASLRSVVVSGGDHAGSDLKA
jgi:hypothetical protein